MVWSTCSSVGPALGFSTRRGGEGLDYGVPGPGAANLALSILTDCRGRLLTASRCQAFALRFIVGLDRTAPWTISETEIGAWLAVVEDQDPPERGQPSAFKGGSMATRPDDLAAWIAELRDRMARGALDGRGTVVVSSGVLAVGEAARLMLADLDHYDDLPPERRQGPLVEARRRLLFSDLRRLCEQIG